MAAIKTRLLEAFKNLSWMDPETSSQTEDRKNKKTDEKPRTSRAEDEESNNGNYGGIKMDDFNAEFMDDEEDSDEQNEGIDMEMDMGFLNTQAKGNVLNIVNSSQVHCGPLQIFYNYGPNDQRQFSGHWAGNTFGNFKPGPQQSQNQGKHKRREHRRQSSNSSQSSHTSNESTKQSEDIKGRARPSTSSQQSGKHNVLVEVTADVKALMQSKEEPTHKYLKHISWSLGREWKEVFILLGYKYKIIETFEIDAGRAGYSIREARYQLLLDWIGNNDANTLGDLTSKLWDAGETDIVQELAEIHKQESEKGRKPKSEPSSVGP